MSPPRKCSYFLVRYVPDSVRNESINIGLLLHSPEEQYLGALFTDDWRRVKRFHTQADLRLLRSLQEHFEAEIDDHEGRLDDYLRLLQDSLSNLIQLNPPRSCFLDDPQTQIEDLFFRYVGSPSAPSPLEETRLRIKQRLRSAFLKAGVWERLEKRIPASRWTRRGDPFTFDFGYKPDGVIQLIHALSLRRDTQLAKSLVYTLDRVGKVEAAHLTAVVESDAGKGDAAAHATGEILEEAGIAVQSLAGIQTYAESIRQELRI
ncbi:MAG: DUF3037 domain-containing protein [Terriglobia bacterium]